MSDVRLIVWTGTMTVRDPAVRLDIIDGPPPKWYDGLLALWLDVIWPALLFAVAYTLLTVPLP